MSSTCVQYLIDSLGTRCRGCSRSILVLCDGKFSIIPETRSNVVRHDVGTLISLRPTGRALEDEEGGIFVSAHGYLQAK
jgi:hypothetical protein